MIAPIAEPRLVVELVDGRHAKLRGEMARALNMLLAARNEGVTLAAARDEGVDLEHAQWRLRRDWDIDVGRVHRGCRLASPVRVSGSAGLAALPREVEIFWNNRFDAARETHDAREAAKAKRLIPTAVLHTPDGERMVTGEVALELFKKFGLDRVMGELSVNAAAQLSDFVTRPAFWPGAHRIYALREGVSISEFQYCDTRRHAASP